jgi:serine/threonine protein kinase
LGYRDDGEFGYVYMERVSSGTLKHMLKTFGKLNEILIKKYTRQIVAALEYLHSKNMLHGNLKVHHSSLSNSSVQTF